MIDNEITIVTAFYDIGRKDIKNFERDNDKYLSYFEFLA
ncbi:protein YibB, partial [Campylobacter jejuni]|nr:protein YibB [Campylobacter jejuni]EAL7670485.1 protein YibB [Campylobacter jejuni]EAL9322978.1 protein YibB [Campylobacter jejuni]EHQ5965131.1 protein YibB [Campylobacter jejuni]EHX0381704.1 protein YibB [Campylobacter jejuni]